MKVTIGAWIGVFAIALFVNDADGFGSYLMPGQPKLKLTWGALKWLLGGMWDEAGTSLETLVKKVTPVNMAKNVAARLQKIDNCMCKGLTCQCCAAVPTHIPFGNGLCFKLQADPEKFQVNYSLTLEGFPLIKGTKSAANPPPICSPIPFVPILSICLRAFGISVDTTASTLDGCFSSEVKAITKSVASVALYCVRVGPKQVSVFPAPKPPNNATVNLGLSSSALSSSIRTGFGVMTSMPPLKMTNKQNRLRLSNSEQRMASPGLSSSALSSSIRTGFGVMTSMPPLKMTNKQNRLRLSNSEQRMASLGNMPLVNPWNIIHLIKFNYTFNSNNIHSNTPLK